MDEYPDPEEEFELMYGNDYEDLREMEGLGPSKSQATTANNLSQKSGFNSSHLFNASQQIVSSQTSFRNDYSTIENGQTANGESSFNASQLNEAGSSVKKRTLNELFGDIDDLLSEEITGPKLKKYKTREEQDTALIEHIVLLRKLAREKENPILTKSGSAQNFEDRYRDNISYEVPNYPFIAITSHNGDRVYVRCHSEEFEASERARICQATGFVGIMGETFKTIWNEANELINKQLDEERMQQEAQTNMETPIDETINETTKLWVDLYKPRKYWELLSDESTNRILLRWVKLWDKVVFNRRPKINQLKKEPQLPNKFNRFQRKELNTTLDETGRPEHKVALLCGPPGLGKTTLAHMVAKHAGYNVVEINASDDRTVDSFKTVLENATQMRSILDQEQRPNCIVFDEIDGAPPAAIDFLIKFIQGNVVTKAKKGKNQKASILKRPIICICNDVYVPALRPLRQIAFVVNFPQTSSARLAERLCEIARYQQIKTDMGAMMALSEKTSNDIRACLSVLHFYKVQNKPVTMSEIGRASIGQKDMQKGLFSVWQSIFQIERPKAKVIATGNSADNVKNGEKGYDMSLKSRMNRVYSIVNSFGDYDRVAEGIFENYTNMVYKDSNLIGTSTALEWFCFTDLLNRQIYSLQNYTLSSYLPFAFVMWHFVFGSLQWQKITYPSVPYEVRSRVTKQKAMTSEVLKGMPPNIRTYVQSVSLKLDILPLLSQIIIPNFRPVNLHLYTPQEKDQLIHVVSVMIDYNLNYVQERTPEGNYVYNIDPNIDEIIYFPGMKPKKIISHSNKQLLAHEIDLEKMRRLEHIKHKKDEPMKKLELIKKTGENEKALPNHLQKLKPKAVKNAVNEMIVTKDFFGRMVTKKNSDTDTTDAKTKQDIWYQYKEGHTNAVRKKLLMSNLK